jgi:tellurite resistance protein
MVDAGMVDALVAVCERTLMEGQERVRYEAGRVLGVLSKSKRFHAQLLEARAVPCLLQLLEPNFVITRVEALAALGNLAGSSPAACEAVLSAGTQEKLNEISKFDKRPEVQSALQGIQSVLTPTVEEDE